MAKNERFKQTAARGNPGHHRHRYLRGFIWIGGAGNRPGPNGGCKRLLKRRAQSRKMFRAVDQKTHQGRIVLTYDCVRVRR